MYVLSAYHDLNIMDHREMKIKSKIIG